MQNHHQIFWCIDKHNQVRRNFSSTQSDFRILVRGKTDNSGWLMAPSKIRPSGPVGCNRNFRKGNQLNYLEFYLCLKQKFHFITTITHYSSILNSLYTNLVYINGTNFDNFYCKGNWKYLPRVPCRIPSIRCLCIALDILPVLHSSNRHTKKL